MLASEVLYFTNVKNVERTIDSLIYGANEITCTVKSIVNPHLVIRKNETTHGKQK